MGARRTTEEKLEERVHETRNEIIEMRKQIRDWTRNASSREGYCCWTHQQANPNLVEIPPHKIPDFLHNNVENEKDPYYGALKKTYKRKLGKQENRGTEKIELQEQNKALTPRRHYPRLGVAELAFILSPIQHSTLRRDARRLGVNGVARELALH
ncbi:hypothetical protein PIB30_056266 [Stylosanthes scabra]|uniref:Uncharacterized protein n=1 Tax=Stylosanthes scabra TaxID=79078 RepID=A0ABU6SK13_9FABA|nr:hypothetical protein [Stylosanthes scabra]